MFTFNLHLPIFLYSSLHFIPTDANPPPWHHLFLSFLLSNKYHITGILTYQTIKLKIRAKNTHILPSFTDLSISIYILITTDVDPPPWLLQTNLIWADVQCCVQVSEPFKKFTCLLKLFFATIKWYFSTSAKSVRCVCKQYSEILYRDLFNHMRWLIFGRIHQHI